MKCLSNFSNFLLSWRPILALLARWINSLIERRGYNKPVVVLANKNCVGTGTTMRGRHNYARRRTDTILLWTALS